MAPTLAPLNTLLGAARILRESGLAQPLVALDAAPGALEPLAARCAEEGVPCFAYGPPAGPPDPGKLLLELAADLLQSDLTHVQAVRESLRAARHVLDAAAPALLIVAEETIGYAHSPVVQAAAARGIPTLVLPYTLSSPAEPAEVLLTHADYERLFSLEPRLNRLVARLLPSWVYEHQGRRLLRWLPLGILTQWWYGIDPPTPWVYNSGQAAALAVESPYMLDLYRRAGLPAEKLAVTGALAEDHVHAVRAAREESRRRFVEEAGLSLRPGDRLVVVGIPCSIDITRRTDMEFESHRAMAEEMVAVPARAEAVKVLVSLHPSLERSAFAGLEQPGRVALSPRPVAELLAVADLYVACISATIRWALACGVPVVDFDAYRLGFTDYDDAPGVRVLSRRAEFRETVGTLLDEPAALEGLRQEAVRDAPRWGRPDGRAAERLQALLAQLLAGERPPHPRPRGAADGRRRLLRGVAALAALPARAAWRLAAALLGRGRACAALQGAVGAARRALSELRRVRRLGVKESARRVGRRLATGDHHA